MTTVSAQPPAKGSPAVTSAIRTEGLRKTYKSSRGDVEAVRGIDLDIPQGEFFGLLGPNGAGKSTTIGMLTTLVLPAGGRAWVAGLDVVADPVGVKRRIGVVTQNNTLDNVRGPAGGAHPGARAHANVGRAARAHRGHSGLRLPGHPHLHQASPELGSGRLRRYPRGNTG